MLDALSSNHVYAIALGAAPALAVAGAAAWLLRGARIPGGAAAAALAGGMLAGVLLGPGVLGNIAPAAHQAVTVGGMVEHRAYADRLREARGAVAALEESGVTGVAIDEYERDAMAQLQPLRDAVDVARVERRGVWDFALTVVGAAMLAGLPLAGITRIGGDIPRAARRAALIAGPVSFALSAGIMAVALGVFTRWGWSAGTLLFAAACATGWFAPPIDRVARERPRAVREAFVSGLFALSIASAIMLWSIPDRRAWWASTAFVVAVLLWGVLKVRPPGRTLRFKAKAFALHWVAPTAVALAAARVDPLPVARDSMFWIVLLAAIVACTDGRWFGALLGAR
ncbi:MAG: hypothetical protein ACTS27_11370, partial [Phycisphaerales bacterium]